MSRIVRILFTTFLLLLMTIAVAGQQTQQQPPKTDKPQTGKDNNKQEEEVKLATELVQFDAVVLNKSGKLIGGLKKEDFEVLEDGKPQALSFFASENHKPIDDLKNLDLKKPSENLDKQGDGSKIENGRVVLIIFDNLHMDVANVVHARDSLLRFVDDNVQEGDRVAIITTAGGTGILQQLTDDRTVIKAAIKRLTPRFGVDDHQQPRITDYYAQLIQRGDKEALDAAIKNTIIAENMTNIPAASAYQIAYSIVQGQVSSIMGQTRLMALASFDTIINAIRAMKTIKGRKLAVFVSDGFPMLESELSARVMDVIDAATRSGVVIYSLDARGLYTIIPGGDASQGNHALDTTTTATIQSIERDGYEAAKDVMNALSRDTGGFPIFNSNDLQLGLKRTLDDNSNYYILAYYPTNTKSDGKFREIKVVLKSHPGSGYQNSQGIFRPGS